MSFEIPPAVIHDLAEGMRTAEGEHADDYHAFADYMEECGSTPASSANELSPEAKASVMRWLIQNIETALLGGQA